MTNTIAFVLGFMASLLANYSFPPLRRATDALFSWLFHILNPDRFDLTGKWRQGFTEPMTEDPTKWEQVEETVQLKHLGSRVTGIGETHDDHRKFKYDLRVQHNLIFGSYVKSGQRGNITGIGVIQMIVSPDRLQMIGQATWFDHDTNRVESSECTWSKQT